MNVKPEYSNYLSAHLSPCSLSPPLPSPRSHHWPKRRLPSLPTGQSLHRVSRSTASLAPIPAAIERRVPCPPPRVLERRLPCPPSLSPSATSSIPPSSAVPEPKVIGSEPEEGARWPRSGNHSGESQIWKPQLCSSLGVVDDVGIAVREKRPRLRCTATAQARSGGLGIVDGVLERRLRLWCTVTARARSVNGVIPEPRRRLWRARATASTSMHGDGASEERRHGRRRRYPAAAAAWAPWTLLALASWRGSIDTGSTIIVKCNPFSAELFNIGSTARAVPFLCNPFAGSSAQSEDPTEDYCKHIWKYCKKTPIWNSPFQSSVQENAGLTSSSSMLTDLWQSEQEFCASFSGTPDDQSVCFNDHGVSFNTRQPSTSPRWMCLEKIGNGSYNNMAPHPDGSNKIFLSSQDGKIWLVTVPEQGMGGSLQLDGTSLLLDLSNEDYLNSEPGLVGIAFHPEFENNGRYFVSYICDRTKSPSCAGKCSCDCNVGCDPTKLRSNEGIKPCQHQLVVSEYSANDSSSDNSEGTNADPSEVRRIFTMGLAYASNHGGQILFGPTDGYLYLVTSNGGKKDDSFNFSQNKRSLLGKILRLDIDELPRLSNSTYENLLGNYSIPNDNPYAKDNNVQPEIWALGLRNPSRCSFDSKKPFYFYCADNGEYEVIDLISKGGNYGPGAYEDLHVSEDIASASIIGGYVYRGSVDPGLYGRYLYFDAYASAMGIGTEIPPSSGKYTFTTIPFNCSKKTPIPCDDSANSPLGEISSFGEDNNKDIFLLASKGVYRVVQPSFCTTEPMPNPAMYNGTTISNNRKPSKWTLLLKIVVPVTVAGLLGAAAWSCYCRCFGNNISCFSCFNRGSANVDVNNNEALKEDPAPNLPERSPPKLCDIELTGVIYN